MNTIKQNNGFAGDQKINRQILYKKIGNLKKLLSKYLIFEENDRALIAGCGKGDEAFILHETLSIPIVGIDISLPKENKIKTNNIELLKSDLNAIPFPDNSFSFIYCYHVLEHVETPSNVLKELHRILQKNKIIFIGFPNRLRITPSYLNSNLKKGLLNIIKQNGKDYWKKITGKFKNELGAHAGFSEKEFIIMAEKHFQTIIPIRKEWIKFQYPKYRVLFSFLSILGIANYFYPSNYYILKK